MNSISVCSVVWLARLLWEQELSGVRIPPHGPFMIFVSTEKVLTFSVDTFVIIQHHKLKAQEETMSEAIIQYETKHGHCIRVAKDPDQAAQIVLSLKQSGHAWNIKVIIKESNL